jgi:DUF4097 and DUF4098 domain-containing protein YvlB
MASSSDRIRILKMIEEGKITAEEGVRLLEQGEGESTEQVSSSSGGMPRWLHVMVTDTHTGKVRVNVRLPVNLVNAGMKLGARLSTEVDNLDMNQIGEFIRNGYIGPVVDVTDDEDDEHVQVFLE